MNAHFSVGAGYDKIKVRMNIDRCLKEKYRGVPYDSVVGGTLAVCGNGPSLKTCKLPEGPVVALNGALQVLVDRGICPKYSICYDPSPENFHFFKDAPKKTVYFIASRCDPKVFDVLKNRDVRVFHVFDSPEMEAVQQGVLNSRMVPGGSTVGLKSLPLLAAIGYDKFDLYGYDSCLVDGEHHATRQEWNDGQEVHEIEAGDPVRRFKSTTWMAAQVQEAIEQFDEHKLIYTVDVKTDGLLKAVWEASTMQEIYDLNFYPPTFNFLEWMMNKEVDRKVKGFKRLKVWLRPGSNEGFREEPTILNTASKEIMLENVVRPVLKMFGAVEGGNGKHFSPISYVVGPCVAAVKKGHQTPEFGPDRACQAWAHKLVGNEPFVTITLRESYYWPQRNSNIEAWTAFAKTLKDRVIFIRDTDKADEPLGDFETCATAARDLEKRTALYRRAKMNYFVSNGPAMLAMMGNKIPYICFMPKPSNGYFCNSSEWLKKNSGIERGDQWPWASSNQKMVWEDDTLDNITKAHREILWEPESQTSALPLAASLGTNAFQFPSSVTPTSSLTR